MTSAFWGRLMAKRARETPQAGTGSLRFRPNRPLLALLVGVFVALQSGFSVARVSAQRGTSPRTTTCSGYSFRPGDAPKIPGIVKAKPAGTVFCFAPGTYRMTGTIISPNYD